MINEFRIALQNIKVIDPSSIEDYISTGGYKALKKVLTDSPNKVVDEIVKSGLRGRGGAGFLTGLKERLTTDNQCSLKVNCSRYVVCNADEGEPGTFKDRIIMENDPHLLVEGLIIAAYAVEAEEGYIYIRGEYYKSIEMVKLALQEAYSKGFLGKNIFGSKYSFNLSLKLGAGSYLCGEELTLLESLEGNRGYPRIKPPYPAQVGLFGMPTLINNVETLSHIPSILLKGSDWYKSIGTKNSPGTKIFTVSGDVKNPGYFEVEMGTKLETIIYNFAGGVKDDKNLKAALIGGAAGVFVPNSFVHLPMDFDVLKKNDFVLGSGAIIVMKESRSVFKMLKSILEFFSNESCGKCIPCRVGIKHLNFILNALVSNNNNDNDYVELCLRSMLEYAELIAKTALCPLGQSPLMPIKSAIKYFKYEAFNS